MVEIQSLNKKYNDFHAVKNLSLTVQPGEMFGFLGPNGAGKTTTIRMLMGILVPTSGTIFIDGKDSFKERVAINKVIGYLPDAPIFYDFLKGSEILQFVGEMHGLTPPQAKTISKDLMSKFGLLEAGNEFAVNYSMGMKKKLGLACALIHQPKILILDEPTNGLDPRASREVQTQMQDFVSSGGTLFLSTHLLDMAQRLCNRVGVISHGELVTLGTLDEIRSELKMGGSLEELFLKVTENDSANPGTV